MLVPVQPYRMVGASRWDTTATVCLHVRRQPKTWIRRCRGTT